MIFLLALSITVSFAQEVKEAPKEGWKQKVSIKLLFNQFAFSNWVKGGENNIAGTIGLTYDFNYVKGPITWDNKIRTFYGLTNSKSSQFAKKTDDRFELNSIFAKKAGGYWSYSVLFNFKTQFTKGYIYSKDINGKEIRTEHTHIMSPGKLEFGPGLLWKESDNLKFNLAPATGKLVIVDKKFTLPNEAYFGVEEGKSTRLELGISASGYAKYDIMKNVSVEHLLELYSNYFDKPGNIDLDYTLNIVMEINDYLTTDFTFQTIYDDNDFRGFQVREVFGLGIKYEFPRPKKIEAQLIPDAK